MSESLPPVVEPVQSKNKSGLAIASLVLGIISLCAWVLWFCGAPISIAAIILGILGMKSSQKGMAIAGIIMGGIGILLTIFAATILAIAGPLLGGFDVNSWMNNYMP